MFSDSPLWEREDSDNEIIRRENLSFLNATRSRGSFALTLTHFKRRRNMVDTGLEGKVALITGANHGIGAATAAAFAREGADVFLTYLRLFPEKAAEINPEEAEKTAEPGRRREQICRRKLLEGSRFGAGALRDHG
jgi:hypothetical protein